MRPFTDTVGELGAGHTLDLLTEQMAEVVTAVAATGKVGKLNLELTVQPNGAYGVAILDKITTKIPQPDRGASLFFIDKDGGLHRSDPNQIELPLRQVSGAEATKIGEAS